MAQRVTLVDDLDNESPAKTVTFSVRDKSYEIDLGEANRTELESILSDFEDKMTKFIEVARTAGKSQSTVDTKAVRAWALENGYDVKPKGRIHKDVVEAYENRNKRTK